MAEIILAVEPTRDDKDKLQIKTFSKTVPTALIK
jgi:hypothetical protein